MIETSLSKSRYENFETSEAVKEGWNNLLADSTMPNIFLTWEWVTTWWKWFGDGKQLRLIVIWDNSKMVGILPVYIGKRALLPFIKVKAIIFVGDGGPVCPEYLSPIIREPDVGRVGPLMAEALGEISRECKVIHFSDVLLNSRALEVLLSYLSLNLYVQRSAGVRCPFKSLPADYAAFLSEFSAKRRKALRWMLKKISKQYKVTLECHTTVEEVDRAFERIMAIFNQSKRGRTSNRGFNKKDYLGFHQEVSKAFAQQGWLRIYFLCFDSVPVAFIYGYLYHQTFWFYQTAFNRSYHQDSPGTIILQMVFESLIQEGAREFDFLRGEENYKYHFTAQEREATTVTLWQKQNMLYWSIIFCNYFKDFLKERLKRTK